MIFPILKTDTRERPQRTRRKDGREDTRERPQKGDTPWILQKKKFCQYCGKPLTEEAWKELERRFRG